MNNKFYTVGKEEYVATFLSPRLGYYLGVWVTISAFGLLSRRLGYYLGVWVTISAIGLLSRRLPEGTDEFHETPQLRLPVSWPRFELVTYRGEVTSVNASAGLVRKSYR